MTTLAQLHDCHSCNDERSIDQKKYLLPFVPLLELRCCNWLGFALAAFCAFHAVFALPSQDTLSGL